MQQREGGKEILYSSKQHHFDAGAKKIIESSDSEGTGRFVDPTADSTGLIPIQPLSSLIDQIKIIIIIIIIIIFNLFLA